MHCSGPGSIVRRCLHRQTGAQFAVKVVDVASSDVTDEGYIHGFCLRACIFIINFNPCSEIPQQETWPDLE